MLYICVYSSGSDYLLEENFAGIESYYLFLISNSNSIKWAKLINRESGELIEEYHSFELINPDFFNLTIKQKDYPHFGSLILIQNYKIEWLKHIVRKYSDSEITKREFLEIDKKTIKIISKDTNKDGFFIPKNLVLVEKNSLLYVMERVMTEFEENPYKLRIIKEFINLKGYEIKMESLFLKQ